MADTVKEVVIQVSIKQAKASLSPPDTSKFQAALGGVQSQLSGIPPTVQSSADDAFKLVADEIELLDTELDSLHENFLKNEAAREEAMKKAAKAAAEAEAAAAKVRDGWLRAGEGFNAAGSGLFTLTRGAALTFTTTDEGFQEMIKNVAKLQAGFDLFRGSIDTAKGLTNTIIGLKAATGAATAAEAIYTTAITAKARAANIATASLVTMHAALGPIGLAVAGITVAVGVLAGAWSWWRSAADGPRNTKDQVDALNESLAIRARLESELASSKVGIITQESMHYKLVSDALGYEISAREHIAHLSDNQIKREGARARILDATKKGLEEEERFFEVRTENTRERIRLGEEAVKIYGDERKEALSQLDTIAKTAQARQRDLDTQRESLKTAQEAVKAERDRVDAIKESEAAKLGQLDPQQQAELKKLAGKVQGGKELSREELDRLGRLGGGNAGISEYVQREQAKRGSSLQEELSGIDAFKRSTPLEGEGSKLEGAIGKRDEVANSLRELQKANQEKSEEEAALINDLTRLSEESVGNIKQQAEAIEKLRVVLRNSEEALIQTRAELERSNQNRT